MVMWVLRHSQITPVLLYMHFYRQLFKTTIYVEAKKCPRLEFIVSIPPPSPYTYQPLSWNRTPRSGIGWIRGGVLQRKMLANIPEPKTTAPHKATTLKRAEDAASPDILLPKKYPYKF